VIARLAREYRTPSARSCTGTRSSSSSRRSCRRRPPTRTSNKATPALFAKYPTARDLAHADPADVEQLVFTTGFYRSKTRSLLGMARKLDDGQAAKYPLSSRTS